MIKFPINFQEQAQGATKGKISGPPYQISARDLMKNFTYSAIDADDSWVDSTIGFNGYQSRRLKLPPTPGDGVYVLGSVNNVIQWIKAEEC